MSNQAATLLTQFLQSGIKYAKINREHGQVTAGVAVLFRRQIQRLGLEGEVTVAERSGEVYLVRGNLPAPDVEKLVTTEAQSRFSIG